MPVDTLTARRYLGHLAPIGMFAAALLIIPMFFRVVLTLWLHNRLDGVPDWWRIFTVGFRMDSVLMGYALVATPLFFLAPRNLWKWTLRPWQIYVVGIISLVLLFELASFRFLEEFDHRPDRLFWEYLRYPKEVSEMLLKSAWVSTLLGIIVMPIVGYGLWKAAGKAHTSAQPWPWYVCIPLFPIYTGLVILCARGTLDHRPVNVSNSAFSTENIANQLAGNSTMTAVYGLISFSNEDDETKSYGDIRPERMIELTLAAARIPPSEVLDEEIPTLHRQVTTSTPPRPRNLVIILQESFAAQFVGCLGGTPTTPCFDALTADGLLLTNLFATGTRTVRGMEAILCGFPPSPATSVVKLGLAQNNFFMVAELMRRQGYRTMFIYGGQSTFDNMRSFMLGNGVQEVWDQHTFKDPVFAGTWGVSDEDLFREAHTHFTELGDAPFCAIILSTSNHTPFEWPAGRIEQYGDDLHTPENGVKYADYAIGQYFTAAKKSDYYQHTNFLIVADHNVRTKGDSLVPPYGFHIPALLIGPDFTPGSQYTKPCSQIDLLPTLLPHLGMDLVHPMIGHDLLSLPADYPGRAIMQFGSNHGYLLGDRMVVHVPGHPPSYFTIDDQHHAFPTTELWPDLSEEALANARISPWLYSHRAWRLPDDMQASGHN